MIERVSFMLGGVAALIALPLGARADEAGPEPSASPVPHSQPTTSPKPRPKHVHGANDVAKIPADRVIEWTLETLDGPRFRLSAYRGMVVFAHLFATWCEPCREEQPELVAFARAHADDTAVIGVNMWEEDNLVRAYRKKYDVPYPIAMHRQQLTMPNIFREQVTFPTTVVFHPEGTLSCAWQGTRSRAWYEAEREYALNG